MPTVEQRGWRAARANARLQVPRSAAEGNSQTAIPRSKSVQEGDKCQRRTGQITKKQRLAPESRSTAPFIASAGTLRRDGGLGHPLVGERTSTCPEYFAAAAPTAGPARAPRWTLRSAPCLTARSCRWKSQASWRNFSVVTDEPQSLVKRGREVFTFRPLFRACYRRAVSIPPALPASRRCASCRHP